MTSILVEVMQDMQEVESYAGYADMKELDLEVMQNMKEDPKLCSILYMG
jgi:hypothetical protein